MCLLTVWWVSPHVSWIFGSDPLNHFAESLWILLWVANLHGRKVELTFQMWLQKQLSRISHYIPSRCNNNLILWQRYWSLLSLIKKKMDNTIIKVQLHAIIHLKYKKYSQMPDCPHSFTALGDIRQLTGRRWGGLNPAFFGKGVIKAELRSE